VVVAMILNGLGFVDHRLYMVGSFYENKPVDKLLGGNMKGVSPAPHPARVKSLSLFYFSTTLLKMLVVFRL
jgi:hypothetical protein